MADLTDDPIKRLAMYWFRARMMHDFVHAMKDEVKDRGGLDQIYENGEWWEFETFICYWLSALFVVVEGFNRLKLKDARVQRLFTKHMRHLKAMRHETYHFVLGDSPGIAEMLRQINWAEDLHEAIGQFLREYIAAKATGAELIESEALAKRRSVKRTTRR